MEEEKNYIKKMKGLSKALSIISKICKVFIIIGTCGILFAMVIIPLLFKKITVTNNELKINDESILTITEKEDKMELTLFGKVVMVDVSKEEFEEIEKIFNEKSKGMLLTYIEATMCIAVATLVIIYMALHYIDKLFTNIMNEKSPFTMDNVNYIRRCGYYLIAAVAVPLVLSGIFEIITKTELMFNWNLVEVILILVIFTMSYVFEYGYNVENKEITSKKIKTIKE